MTSSCIRRYQSIYILIKSKLSLFCHKYVFDDRNISGAACLWRAVTLYDIHVIRHQYVNTLRLRQNGCHFADATIKCIFLNGNAWIKTSVKFVPKGPINIIPAFVELMAWRRPCDKPLSEPMKVKILTHTCVTRPQWVTVVLLGAFSQNVSWSQTWGPSQ